MNEKKTCDKKPPEIVVKPQRKVISEFGYNPSLIRYLLSHILFPAILTVFFAMFRQGILLIIPMWAYFLWRYVTNYREIYPKPRKATEEEVEMYNYGKMKEAINLKDRYDSKIKKTDIYGYPKMEDEEFNPFVKEALDKYGETSEMVRLKEIESEERKTMEGRLIAIEEEYGPDWYENFKKEIRE